MSSKDRYKYSQILQSDATTSDHRFRYSAGRYQSLILAILVACLSSGLTLLFLRFFQHETPCTPRTHLPRLSCGNSTTEALAIGCTFDPLSVTWLPQRCQRHGTEAFAEYPDTHNTTWKYWYDKEGKNQIPDQQSLAALGGNGIYWTTQREHLTHCVYMLLRVHHAMETGDRIDRLGRSYDHSKHCLMMLLSMRNQTNDDKITTGGDVSFSGC
jgi:hypothetical protein